MTESTEEQTAEEQAAQQKKISGYRKLSETEIDAVNRIKAKGNEFAELLNEIAQDPDIDVNDDWMYFGQVDMQKGIMQVIRSITQPDGF